MRTLITTILQKENYVPLVILVSGIMAAFGQAGNAPFIKIVAVIGLFNLIAGYWFNRLCESTQESK